MINTKTSTATELSVVCAQEDIQEPTKEYKELNEKCDQVLAKISKRKSRKSKKCKAV